MNARKAIIYVVIMFVVPFVFGFILSNTIHDTTSEALYISVVGAFYITLPILFLGFLAEGVQYTKGKYNNSKKVFWHEWIESSFSIWILAAIIISVIQLYLRFR